jgi:hypothetical protein
VLAAFVVGAVAVAGLTTGLLLGRHERAVSGLALTGLVGSFIAAHALRHSAANALDRWSLRDSQARAASFWAVFAALALAWLTGLFVGRYWRANRPGQATTLGRHS